MPKFLPKNTKTILNKMKNIDSWFWCRYSLNPYSGCQHGCIYCDGRSQKYYVHEDFDNIIYYKPYAAQMLEKKIKNSRSLQPDIIAAGGTCDSYQPAEKDFRITQQILKVLIKYNWPIGISTKNVLIKRDLPLLYEIAQQTYAAINFSISTPDDEIAKHFEPGASPPSERFRLIKQIREKYPEIKCGINYMPIVPIIQDTQEQISKVIQKASDMGAEYILFAPHLTLREGNQKNFFLKKLKDYCNKIIKQPELYIKFEKEFANGTANTSQSYLIKKSNEIVNLCKKYGLALRAPRWYPNDFRNQNYRAAENLLNTYYYDFIRGKKRSKLLWAGFEIQNLKVSLGQLVSQNKLNTLKNFTPEVYKIIKPYIKKPSSLDSFMV